MCVQYVFGWCVSFDFIVCLGMSKKGDGRVSSVLGDPQIYGVRHFRETCFLFLAGCYIYIFLNTRLF